MSRDDQQPDVKHLADWKDIPVKLYSDATLLKDILVDLLDRVEVLEREAKEQEEKIISLEYRVGRFVQKESWTRNIRTGDE